MNTVESLSEIFLFESLSSEQLEFIKAASSIKSISKNELLFSEGQAASSFFFVVSGAVKIYKLSAEGSEQILHIQKPGDLVAEAIIFEFDNYPAYCQAIEDTVLIRFPKIEFLSLLRHFPEISFKIMNAYSRRMRMLVAKIEELSLQDIKTRLANYLIQNSSFREHRQVCILSLTKKDLASVLGTIPETLSRTLHYFKKEKIIEEDRNAIVIMDGERLKKLAQR